MFRDALIKIGPLDDVLRTLCAGWDVNKFDKRIAIKIKAGYIFKRF